MDPEGVRRVQLQEGLNFFFEETARIVSMLCMCHGQNMVFGGEKSYPVIHPMGILNNSYRYINPDECILV